MAHVIRIVRWEELSPSQKIDVENLKISDQQIEYAGPTRRAVEACISDLTGDIQGAAIFDGEVIVGFLVLKRRSAAPSWASTGAAVISALRVDLRVQGLGIGTAALQRLPEWLGPTPRPLCFPSTKRMRPAAVRMQRPAGWIWEPGTREESDGFGI
jgi:GNAT superfamily N-acetyltransferase